MLGTVNEATSVEVSPILLSRLLRIAERLCTPVERLVEDALYGYLRLNATATERAEWKRDFADLVAEIHAGLPERGTDEEIDADIDIAVEEVRLERLARGH